MAITTALLSGYCQNSAAVSLSAYPSGGTFTGSGVTGSVFTPAMANTGSQSIVYSYTDGNNCSNSDTISTTVYSVPNVNITTQLNGAYCSNDAAVSLAATPTGGTFSGNGVTGSTFDPSTSGAGLQQIIYSYTNGDGCTDSDTLTTTVNAAPTAYFTTLSGQNLCKDGSTLTLTASPSGGAFAGNGLTANVFYVDSVNAGTYSLYYSYTDGAGCTDSDTIQVNVNALPSVSISNFNDICSGASALMLSGGSPSGGNYSGNGVSGGYFYPSVAGAGLSAIIYGYTDSNGCFNSDTAQIRVVGTPSATFSLQQSACKGDTVNVLYSGGASANATFSWDFDNALVLSGSAAGPYSLRWDTAGIKALTLTVTDSGCTSNTYSNYTNIIEAIAMISTVGSNQACYGDSVMIFANSGPGYTYQWYDTSGLLTSPADTLSFYNALQSGVYYAKVTNDYGCSAVSGQMGITIHPQLFSDFSLPATACKDAIVNINYNGLADTAASYNWNFDGGVVATGSGAGPYGIIWNSDSLKTVQLTVSKYGCSSPTTSKVINLITVPASITALGPTSFCDGGSVTLYPNAGAGYSYQWFKDGISLNDTNNFYTATQSGSYTVEVTNGLGCQNISDSVTVTVNSTDFNLAFTANQTNFTIPPFNVSITNQTQDTSNYYWLWSMGDGTSYTVANPVHQYAYDGTYTVGVVAQNINTGCYDTLVKNSYITCQGGSANPCTLTAAITPAGPASICPGDSILLTAAANHPGTVYRWLKDGVLIQGADTTFYWAKMTGNYQVMVSDTSCSKFSLPFALTLYNTITPAIASNGTITPCTGDSMQLYVTTAFNNYLWSNGMTGSSIYIQNSGNYTVTTTDVNGCQTVSQPFVVNASLLQTPDICIVGVDSATNNNFIVWERQANPLIDSFRIYRESTVAGVYNPIGKVAAADPGYFLDVNSNPMQQAYRYRITAIDTCGMETPYSDIHKTIHLSINAGLNGSWNLIWSHYEGFNFGTYRIYRGFDSTAMQPLTQIQSNLNSYTDLNPPAGNIFYQIEVVSPHPCYPDSVYSKAKTNYNTSRSNHMNTSAAPNTGFVKSSDNKLSMQILPNPNKGTFVLEIVNGGSLLSDYNVQIFNAVGELVHSERLSVSKALRKTMHLESYGNGMYIVRLLSRDNVLTTRFVVQ